MSVAAVVGLVIVVNRDGPTSTGPAVPIEVHHTRIEFTLAGQLECKTPIDTAGTFATMVIDTYSNRSGRQWRNQVTYPDGSTRDLVATGSAVYPSGLYERGHYRGSTLGCVGPNAEPFVLGAEPGQGGFYTLNVSDELAADERPLVLGFREQGTRVEGDHVDSRGRPTELWEQHVNGFAGYGSDANFAVAQITSWWVDPTNGGTVTERRYTDTVAQLGSVTETATLVADETTTVPAGFFDVTDYRHLDPVPRPTNINVPADATVPSPVPPSTSERQDTGDAAVWVAAANQDLTTSSKSFTAQVTRLGCNGGVTGQVLKPSVQIGQSNIVVTFTVERRAAGAARCPSNDQVPYVVDIGEPIGNRKLLDGACLADGEAKSTSFCVGGAVRWSP